MCCHSTSSTRSPKYIVTITEKYFSIQIITGSRTWNLDVNKYHVMRIFYRDNAERSSPNVSTVPIILMQHVVHKSKRLLSTDIEDQSCWRSNLCSKTSYILLLIVAVTRTFTLSYISSRSLPRLHSPLCQSTTIRQYRVLLTCYWKMREASKMQ